MSLSAARVFSVSRDRPHVLIAALALFLLLSTVVLGVSIPMLFAGLLVLGAGVATLIRPEIGLHVLALNAMVGLTRLVELPRLGPFSAPVLIEGLLVGAVMFQLAFLRRRLRFGTMQHALMGLLAIWIFVSVLTGVIVGPDNFQDYRNLFLIRFVVFLLVTALVTSVDGIKRLMVTFMIANVGLLALAMMVRLGYFGQAKITISQEFERTNALLQNPNELAFNLTTMLVLTIVSFLVVRSVTLKSLLLALAAADLVCIMSTLSRSGFISMCVVLLFLFFKLTRNLRALVVDRLKLAQVGLAMAKDHPLLGVGLGNFMHVFPNYNVSNMKAPFPAHNLYLDLAAQMGLPALLLYAGVIWLTWRGLRAMEASLKARGRTRSFEFLFGLGVQAAFVNLAVFGLSGDVEFDYGALILLGLGLTLLKAQGPAQESG